MHPNFARDLSLADSGSQQSRRLHSPLFQRSEIPPHTRWIAHALYISKHRNLCHYFMRDSIGRLSIVLTMTASYMFVEAVGGWLMGSLALVADALHMLTDVFGLSIALVACWFVTPPHGAFVEKRQRAGASAALLNCIIVLGTSLYIFAEGVRRLMHPVVIQGLPLLLIAGGGLVINVAGLMMLQPAAEQSLNVRGAYLQVLVDLLGSVAVILGGLVAYATGWMRADAVVAILVGLLIIPSTMRLAVESVGMLREAWPLKTEYVAR
jgi:cobalt-zinc-cadmium efflux system protein